MWTPSPFFLHSERVRRDWIDYNGHMHEAYYVLVFANATDALYDHLGMGTAYREKRGFSIYTLESHVNYLKEVGVRVPLRVTTQVLAVDDKRMQVFHAMYSGETRDMLATTELMVLHVNTSGTEVRVEPFPRDVVERLEGVMEEHCQIPKPTQAGRIIAMRRPANQP
ncbi:MAG: thioesterase family protein [Pseudomonadota bacterium]|nr:thioesterase family protein [Pseudomonadota bacterium]